MRRWLVGIAAAFAAVLMVVGTSGAGPKKGDTITVRVLSTKVMAQPKFIGKTVTQVSRGEHLTYQASKSGWYQVQTARGVGWIHKSSVVDKKIQLTTDLSSGKSNASKEEIELAGRGFTKDVENQYKQDNRELDFSHVDRIEALTMDPEAVGQFAVEGHVGGAP